MNTAKIKLDRESARQALKRVYLGKHSNWHSPVITVDGAGWFELQPKSGVSHHRGEVVILDNVHQFFDDTTLEAHEAVAMANEFVDQFLSDTADKLNNLGFEAFEA